MDEGEGEWGEGESKDDGGGEALFWERTATHALHAVRVTLRSAVQQPNSKCVFCAVGVKRRVESPSLFLSISQFCASRGVVRTITLSAPGVCAPSPCPISNGE